MRFILIIFVIFSMACEECDPNETRCHGNVVELCSSKGNWETLIDCDDVSGVNDDQWVCCNDVEGYNCLPEDECVGGES